MPQNYTAAREQFELAAEKGLPSAHNGLGVLAWNGQVLTPSRADSAIIAAVNALGFVGRTFKLDCSSVFRLSHAPLLRPSV